MRGNRRDMRSGQLFIDVCKCTVHRIEHIIWYHKSSNKCVAISLMSVYMCIKDFDGFQDLVISIYSKHVKYHYYHRHRHHINSGK